MFGHSLLKLLVIEILVVTFRVDLVHVHLLRAFYVLTELLLVQLQRRLTHDLPLSHLTTDIQNVKDACESQQHEQDVDDDWPAQLERISHYIITFHDKSINDIKNETHNLYSVIEISVFVEDRSYWFLDWMVFADDKKHRVDESADYLIRQFQISQLEKCSRAKNTNYQVRIVLRRRYSIIFRFMQRQKKTDLAISQLTIQLNAQDQNDKYELSDLLCQILTYPTWQEAEVHRKANHLGNFDLLSQQGRLLQLLNSKNTSELQLCSCCGNIVNQKDIAFTTQLPQIKLGIGVRLYFTTLIHNAIIFLVTFVLYSLYTMITNINASKQQIQRICGRNQECSIANIGTGAKLASYDDFKNQLAIQSVLGLVCVLIWAAILVKNYDNDRTLERQLKQDWLSASDFTLMLSNYPAGLLNPKNQQETLTNLKQQFKEYENSVKSRISFEVVKVSIGYPLFGWTESHKKQMQDSQQQIKTKRVLFKNMIKQRQSSPYFQLAEDRRNKEYEEFYQLVTNHQYEKSNCLPELQEKNTIFVTLRYSRARDFILNINKSEKKCLFFKEENKKQDFPVYGVKIEKAPEPDEIKWENIGFPSSLKLFRKVLIYVLAMLLICLTLAISIFLGSFQADKPILISILISIVITVINILIEFIIILLSYFQRQFQKSKEQVSIGIKIAVSQIINCIGVPITLVFLDKQTIYSSGGLVTNVFFIGLINMLLPFVRFIDPFNILLLLRERYYLSPQKRLNELQGQIQLNKICSFYQFQLGYQYSYIIKTAYFTGFYLTLQPIIALFAPIGLICMFYCNKYRLLYRFNKPNFHSSSVNSKLAFFLKCSLVAFTIGQLYFMNFRSYTARFQLILNWVSFALSVIFVFSPLSFCSKFVEESSGGLDYNQQMLYLTTDYDRLNPVTKQKAISNFQQFLQQYEKKCNLPLPQRSQIIRRSIIQVSKHAPASIINFMKQKTKIREVIASELYTMQRLRSS